MGPLPEELEALKGGTRWSRESRMMMVLFAAALIIISTSIVISAIRSGEGDLTSPSDSDDFLMSDGRSVIHRTKWESVPADVGPSPKPLQAAAPFVVIKHTAGPTCAGLAECTPVLRDCPALRQRDTAYSFLVDSSGDVYEGRGWTAAATGDLAGCSLDVALIGNYTVQRVSAEAAAAVQMLLDLGVRRGKVAPLYCLLADSQVANTQSPGRFALEAIAKWPHSCLNKSFAGVQCTLKQSNTATLL